MYKQFNDLANTFLARMEQTFPDEPKVKLYRQKYIILQGMNSRKPVEMFVENMEPFGEKILTRDEKFFKQDDLVKNAESISGKMGLIKYWDSLSDQTKNSIWEYIQGLYVLGMGSLGKTEELKKMINYTGFKAE
jgi:hypothetical protein